jgi:hypothetical protein
MKTVSKFKSISVIALLFVVLSSIAAAAPFDAQTGTAEVAQSMCPIVANQLFVSGLRLSGNFTGSVLVVLDSGARDIVPMNDVDTAYTAALTSPNPATDNETFSVYDGPGGPGPKASPNKLILQVRIPLTRCVNPGSTVVPDVLFRDP